MSSVEYKNISKKYGSVTVMDDISFSISQGKFVVLLGPSGCGKTTLLRMTAGLEKITSGDVFFFGEKITHLHPRDRNIAMVFQSYALYPQMTVFDNIAFSLQIRNIAKDEIKKRVEEIAKVLNLSEYLGRYPKALSGGQRQRVAMGRAMVRQPKIFLFDEPLSNLDAKLRAQMRFEIRRLHDRLDTTTIYVTHDQIEAMTMADEIVVMRDGAIEQIGTPTDIYEQPVNTFVADFIGTPSINFLSASVVRDSDNARLKIQDVLLNVSVDLDAHHDQPVILGIRPLDLEIDNHSPYQGVVTFIENTGGDRHLHIEFAGQTIKVVSAEKNKIKVGDTIGISIEETVMHVFDAKTERRIN